MTDEKAPIMGRPRLADKKRMICVYLKAKEYRRIQEESEKEGIPKSQMIERILINRNYQKYARNT